MVSGSATDRPSSYVTIWLVGLQQTGRGHIQR